MSNLLCLVQQTANHTNSQSYQACMQCSASLTAISDTAQQEEMDENENLNTHTPAGLKSLATTAAVVRAFPSSPRSCIGMHRAWYTSKGFAGGYHAQVARTHVQADIPFWAEPPPPVRMQWGQGGACGTHAGLQPPVGRETLRGGLRQAFVVWLVWAASSLKGPG